ncbi:MAG TPA: MFS transporter [Chthoniobacter sp.]|nr:MFS transporter [Chthoniobacter sp.]
MSLPTSQKPARFHYAWVVVAITFLTLIVGAGVRSVPGVLIVPLEHEFGWTRATVSFAVSINLLLYGLIGPFAAGFINLYGPRRVMLLAFTLVAAGVAATSLVMHQSWQLVVLWGVLVGSGTGLTALVLGATVVHRWFHVHRGTIMGMLTASTATGQLLFLPLLARVIEKHGWRSATLLIVGVLLAMLPLIFFFMRDRPAGAVRPFGLSPDEPMATPAPAGNPFSEALAGLRLGMRSRDFWLLAGSFFICGASTNGLIGTHLIPACMDHGIPEVTAAGLLAVMGIFDLIGTTASGWLSDRFSNRWLLFMYYGLRGSSLLFLPSAFQPETHRLSLFAVFYGLDWIATVPPTVALTAQAFGREKVGIMFGWIVASHQVGAALAAWGAGFIRTNEGAYDHAFLISGSLCVLTAAGVLMIGRKRDKDAAANSLPLPSGAMAASTSD